MNPVFLRIELFYKRLHNGDYDDPLTLAQGLEALANFGWDYVEELYPPSLRIDP